MNHSKDKNVHTFKKKQKKTKWLHRILYSAIVLAALVAFFNVCHSICWGCVMPVTVFAH